MRKWTWHGSILFYLLFESLIQDVLWPYPPGIPQLHPTPLGNPTHLHPNLVSFSFKHTHTHLTVFLLALLACSWVCGAICWNLGNLATPTPPGITSFSSCHELSMASQLLSNYLKDNEMICVNKNSCQSFKENKDNSSMIWCTIFRCFFFNVFASYIFPTVACLISSVLHFC